MKKEELVNQIFEKKSVLCVGLDTSFDKLPPHLKKLPLEEAILSFNKSIIDATKMQAVSYKINTAFYEQYGALGWELMEETLSYIPKNIFTIADAKRGDIGNTSRMYAKAFFDTLNFDAITVAPYMGEDSIKPFLEFNDKWTICLGLTSNSGSRDIQNVKLHNNKEVYKHTMQKVASWANSTNLMFVTGATHPQELSEIRAMFPEHFFLVPGVGAQGGSAAEVCDAAFIPSIAGLLINSSRGILYSASTQNFAEASNKEAQKLVSQMQSFFE